MNAVTKISLVSGGMQTVSCDTAACTVTAGGKSVRVSPTILIMVALLTKAYPDTVPRDRMMKKIFAGNRAQKDPAMCLRQTMKRAREQIEPLGLAIQYVPNAAGSDLPGNYSIGQHLSCPVNLRKRPR